MIRTAFAWISRAIVGLVAIYFLVFVWPTPYRYYHREAGGYLRINRVTGVVDRATYSGWVNEPPRPSAP